MFIVSTSCYSHSSISGTAGRKITMRFPDRKQCIQYQANTEITFNVFRWFWSETRSSCRLVTLILIWRAMDGEMPLPATPPPPPLLPPPHMFRFLYCHTGVLWYVELCRSVEGRWWSIMIECIHCSAATNKKLPKRTKLPSTVTLLLPRHTGGWGQLLAFSIPVKKPSVDSPPYQKQDPYWAWSSGNIQSFCKFRRHYVNHFQSSFDPWPSRPSSLSVVFETMSNMHWSTSVNS